MNSAAAVTVPEPGRLYRCDTSDCLQRSSHLIFVTHVGVTAHTWTVHGYRVSPGYVLTGDALLESGSIGRPYGVPHQAFCAPLGVGAEAGREQLPLFSGRFPASDASLVTAVERQGRARYMP